MKSYSSREWKIFRENIIRLDGGACTVCGRTKIDGVILQVHHKKYIQGHKPWEYPTELCETLCQGCHASEHGVIPPKFGWEHIGYDDLGEPSGICECCGQAIRYVFLVQHEKWPAMEVGEKCCDNLTSTQAASNLMESKRRYAGRLKRFVDSIRWQTLPSGIKYIVQRKIRIEIVPDGITFKLRIHRILGKQTYASVLDAQIKCFDFFESGEIDKFLLRRAAKERDYYESSRYS